MNGKMDKIKGKAKEMAGRVLDKPKLRQAGIRDQMVGEAKERAAAVTKATKVATTRVRKSVERAARS